MKKIIKITESELNRIIRKVISEQQYAQKYDKENAIRNISPGFQNLGSVSFDDTEDPEDRKPEYMKPKTPSGKTIGAVKGKSTKLRPVAPIVKQELNDPEQNV